MDMQVVNNCRRTKRLAIVQLVLSSLIILSGIISTCLSGNLVDDIMEFGINIWIPFIGIITAGLGLGALKNGNYSRKCLLVSYFVMCIISAIVSTLLIIAVCMEFIIEANQINFIYGRDCKYARCIQLRVALYALDTFSLIGYVAQTIASIISTTFICYYWCVLKGNAGQNRIKSTELTLVRKLGQGQFGEVWQSRYTDPSGQTVYVAVKISKHHLNASPDRNLASANCFFQECVALDFLRHPNIIRALGICSNLKMAGGTTTTPALVLEYMDGGNAAEYVLSERNHLQNSDLLRIFIDICNAGEHLEKLGVIHMDIGARNVLIQKHPTTMKPAVAKLTDFGLAKDVGKSTGVYITNADRAIFHNRYTAPEGFRGEFSTQSDIWSFGVFMWEIYMMMDRNQTEPVVPYCGISSEDIQSELCDGYRLERPLKASDDIYSIMTSCWIYAPETRPTFLQLHKTLKTMLSNGGIEQDIEVGPQSTGSMVQLTNLAFGCEGRDLVESASAEHPDLTISTPYGRPS